MSVQKLEADLRAFTDSFVNLVRAAHLGENTTASSRNKAPGDLVEVLAEKILLAAQDLFQTTAELKQRAFLASAGEQLARAERMQTLVDLQGKVTSLESELAEAEEELRKRGRHPDRLKDDSQSPDLQLLYAMAQELSGN